MDWPRPNALNYRGRQTDLPAWAGRILRERGVTDVFMLSEWRPCHSDTVKLAKSLGINVHVFEEGYLRPHYITLERDGVNGASPLPREHSEILQLARQNSEHTPPQPLPAHSKQLTRRTVMYLVARYALFPLYPFSKTHRPYSGFSEYVLGWIPRLFGEKRRHKDAEETLEKLYSTGKPFFLFPLQVDADAQVRRYSPFSNMPEAICHIVTSFAKSAPKDYALLIKNHPLDCGLIDYARYVKSLAKALDMENRVFFVEAGNSSQMIKDSLGLVLLNSTMGLSALQEGKPVYYLGRAICSIPGLGVTPSETSLDDYWHNPRAADQSLLNAFIRVLQQQALLNGDFHSREGQDMAIQNVIERIGA